MSDTFARITLSYPQRDAEELQPLVSALERRLNADLKPWGLRGAGIDLVTILEIVASVVAANFLKPVVTEYAKGFFAADKAKALGEAHRDEVIAALGAIWQDVRKLARDIEKVFQTANDMICRKEAIILHLSFGETRADFVLNSTKRDDAMFASLSDAILDFICICVGKRLPKDTRAIQFWYDPGSRYWRYVFIPTFTRRFVDRFIDLDDGREYHLASPEEFIERFKISRADEWRFIFDPFEEQWDR